MTVRESSELKSLETRKSELETKRMMLNEEITSKQQESAELRRKIGKLKQRIDQLKEKSSNKIIVTEHAMLRYIERVIGIDLKDIESKILAEQDAKVINGLGDCTYNKGDFKIRVKDHKVVTVLTEQDKK